MIPQIHARDSMNDLRLAVFSGQSGDIVTLGDYLALGPAQTSLSDITPSYACISLVIDGAERWGPNLSFGALGLLAAQFPQARDRLERGDRAVIRGAVFDSSVIEYVVFDPTGDGSVLAATAATDALEPWLWLPHEQEGTELYKFIDDHFEEMLAMGFTLRELPPIHVDLKIIARALDRESGLAKRVIELIGPGFY
jgi:hypothetical protein